MRRHVLCTLLGLWVIAGTLSCLSVVFRYRAFTGTANRLRSPYLERAVADLSSISDRMGNLIEATDNVAQVRTSEGESSKSRRAAIEKAISRVEEALERGTTGILCWDDVSEFELASQGALEHSAEWYQTLFADEALGDYQRARCLLMLQLLSKQQERDARSATTVNGAIRLLQSASDEATRDLLIGGLIGIESDVLPHVFMEYLQGPYSSKVRAEAARALDFYRDRPDVIGALRFAAAHDLSPAVRIMAAKASKGEALARWGIRNSSQEERSDD